MSAVLPPPSPPGLLTQIFHFLNSGSRPSVAFYAEHTLKLKKKNKEIRQPILYTCAIIVSPRHICWLAGQEFLRSIKTS